MGKSVLVLIPFFGGEGGIAPSKASNRRDYLERTLESTKDLGDTIVGIIESDKPLLQELGVGFKVFDCDPKFLPLELCRSAQKTLDYDMYYVTEADQVLYYDKDFLRYVTDESHLVPHRLEEIVDKASLDRGAVVTYKKKQYVIPNGNPIGTGVYEPLSPMDWYGGAYFCSKEVFKKINFADMNELHVEKITGLYVGEISQPTKTSNWENCFVEHLSGKEYHEKISRGSP